MTDANIQFKDGATETKYQKAYGTGTDIDPHYPAIRLGANSGVDVGDIDVLSIAAGDTNIGNVDIVTLPAGNLGAQAKAASLCVNPATDITDAIYIGDIKFGEALPEGTALMGKVGIDQATANANEVVVKSITAGTNAIGKLAANSGVDIGDIDITSIVPGVAATNLGKAEDAGHTSGDTGVMCLAVRQLADAALSGTDLDYEPLQTNAIGHLKVSTKDNGPAWTVTRTYTTSADMTTAAAITVAPTAGQKIYADDILVSAAVAMEYSIQEETSATVFASVFLPASGTIQITLRNGIKAAVADKKLYGKASVAGNVRIAVCYHSEA